MPRNPIWKRSIRRAEGDPVKGKEYNDFLEKVLTEKGGNNGQPYKGIEFDFPVEPDPSWS